MTFKNLLFQLLKEFLLLSKRFFKNQGKHKFSENLIKIQRQYKYRLLAAQKKSSLDYCHVGASTIQNLIKSWQTNRRLAGSDLTSYNEEFAESEETYLKLVLETHYPGFQETDGKEQITVHPKDFM